MQWRSVRIRRHCMMCAITSGKTSTYVSRVIRKRDMSEAASKLTLLVEGTWLDDSKRLLWREKVIDLLDSNFRGV